MKGEEDGGEACFGRNMPRLATSGVATSPLFPAFSFLSTNKRIKDKINLRDLRDLRERQKKCKKVSTLYKKYIPLCVNWLMTICIALTVPPWTENHILPSARTFSPSIGLPPIATQPRRNPVPAGLCTVYHSGGGLVSV